MKIFVLFTANSKKNKDENWVETWRTRGVYDNEAAAHADGVTHVWDDPNRRYRIEAYEVRSASVIKPTVDQSAQASFERYTQFQNRQR